MNKKYTYISLFSSAGVGCYAFKELGFECIATNELLEKRLLVQKYNNKCKYDSGYILGDITLEANKKKIFDEIEKWESKDNIKEIDLIAATPPCQGMSVANHKKKDEQKRNSLVLESIYFVQKIKPRYFIFENVRSFLKTLCLDNMGQEKTIDSAIKQILAGLYNIEARIINFKDFGANSSRTRTLVIGIRKDIKNITPNNLFPQAEKEKTLKEVIGKYPPLKKMGEISDNDIYHSFRRYDEKMFAWIENTREGFSAFDNTNPKHKPHSIKNGKLIINTNKNADKYRRCQWDKVMPCIHTRNDILASQSTIHPRDNRVFSIRELMDLMNIPQTFQWAPISCANLNKMPLNEKQKLIQKEDINIRQSIGEAVPTIIFKKIAKNIMIYEKDFINPIQLSDIITNNDLADSKKLLAFVKNNRNNYSFDNLSKIIETANSNKIQTAAFYTPKSICYNIVSKLPDINKNTIRILEPSVGVGNFIPLLCQRYREQKLIIDVIDIDENILRLIKFVFQKINGKKVEINYKNIDFLDYTTSVKYDIVIGNPPFGKVKDKKLLKNYKSLSINQKTSNIFSFFLEHSLRLGKFVSLIIPKSFLSSPEYNDTRKLLENTANIHTIIDFGEKAFYGVKIETVALLLNNTLSNQNYDINVESYITKRNSFISSEALFDKDFNMWLIYADDFFKQMKSKMSFGIFKFHRDREITKKHTVSLGRYRVLKSRNIGNNQIIDIDGYDSYIDDIEPFSVKKFLNSDSLLIPNLTYNPRACFMPKNSIADGSVAILQLIDKRITKKDIDFFASQEFGKFYMLGRNLGSRSLNIDSNSIRLWGVKK